MNGFEIPESRLRAVLLKPFPPPVEPDTILRLLRFIVELLDKPIESDRFTRDPRTLGLLETELRTPLLGFATLLVFLVIDDLEV